MGNVAESAAVAYSETRDEESRAHVRRAQSVASSSATIAEKGWFF
jgi:hypothetical protein